MNYSNSAIQAAYDRVLRLARSYGLEPQWRLVPGTERNSATPRTPWSVMDGDLVLFTLGYTRRGAHETLATIGAVFDYLVTTDDWREENTT